MESKAPVVAGAFYLRENYDTIFPKQNVTSSSLVTRFSNRMEDLKIYPIDYPQGTWQ